MPLKVTSVFIVPLVVTLNTTPYRRCRPSRSCRKNCRPAQRQRAYRILTLSPASERVKRGQRPIGRHFEDCSRSAIAISRAVKIAVIAQRQRAYGYAPLVPLKVASVVNVPLVVTWNTVPSLLLPPLSVVP